jgi:hypothetical protein
MQQIAPGIQGDTSRIGHPQADPENLRYHRFVLQLLTPPLQDGVVGFPMLRCPACHWINLDSDYHCRRCGHFLRHRPLPSSGKGAPAKAKSAQGRRKPTRAGWRQIRWDRVLTSSAILGVLVGLGQLSWYWVQPMLKEPPLPNFGIDTEALRQQDYERHRTFRERIY